MLKKRQHQEALDSKQAQQQQSKEKHVQSSTSEPGARLTAAKRRQLQARDELAELQHDYSMLKKLKKGKISEHAFDVATGLSSDSEDEAVGDIGSDEEGSNQRQQQKQNNSGSFAPPGRSVVKQEQQLRKRKKRRQQKRQLAQH